MTAQSTSAPLPGANRLGVSDITAALKAGMADFGAHPLFGLFFGSVFSAIGIVIAYLLAISGSSYWVLPLAAGFPLIGPFAAVGLYEVSRRRETGEPMTWAGILGAVWREGKFQLPSYAFVVLFVFLIWVYLAHLIFALSFGLRPLTNVMTSSDLLLTSAGITMLVVGTLVGGALASLLFAISVGSVPMLLERDIDVASAIFVSVRAVLSNRAVMMVWGAIIAVTCAVAMIPMFLGMIVAFPVLGHASWHLYRRLVEPPL